MIYNTLKTTVRNTLLILVLSLVACKAEKKDKTKSEISKNSLTDLDFDHFNIWVKNPTKAKESLTAIGFTSVPDSLSQVHHGQGTAGRYFRFLNGYLEFIFVHDQNAFDENNKKNNALDFNERANFAKNGASPISIALKVKDYDITKIPFEKVRYHQDWMEDDTNIYSAKNSKTNLNEPSIFVVYPEIESDTFETLSDLKNIPEEHAIWRAFYKHPNGAKKITNITITCVNLNLNTETIKAVNDIENLNIKDGKDYLIELHFDDDIQGKSYDLRPNLPLKVYL